MKHNIGTKKNVSITITYFKDLYNVESFIVREVNGYKCHLQFRASIKENLETALNYHFELHETKSFVLTNTYVVEDMWYMNDTPVVEINYKGMYELLYAFAKVRGYMLSVNKDHLQFIWSYSLDYHLQNLSSRGFDEIIVEGNDYQPALKKLMKKLEKQIERNCIFVIEIIEFRGNDKRLLHNDNRLVARESVGYEESNFDEDIWKELKK